MNGFILRIIAMATMLLDHIGWNFLEEPMILTWIGRIAFPLYAFLLADGFLIICHDKERLNKHLAIMLVLTIVSFPGYALMEARLDFAHYLDSLSNMVTLLIGYIGMMVTEALLPSDKEVNESISKLKICAIGSAYILMSLANYMMKGNFNIVGPLLVIAFYWLIRVSKADAEKEEAWSWIKRITVLLIIFVLYLIPYYWVRSGFGSIARWWEEVVNYAPWIAGHVIAAVLISRYNGRQGYHKKWFRRLYVSFYPIHTFAIGLICVLSGR